MVEGRLLTMESAQHKGARSRSRGRSLQCHPCCSEDRVEGYGQIAMSSNDHD